MTLIDDLAVRRRCAGRHILFATHGFNVSMPDGVCSLGQLEAELKLPENCQFIGVLWPGDFWIPVVNYPFEGQSATDCGRRLAQYCDQNLRNVASISFVTHSLGARLALQAAAALKSRVRSMCLTAGAVNRECLTQEYAGAFANGDVVSVLASRRDLVLKLAFPIGDVIADLLNTDHVPFEAALGYSGPPVPIGKTVPPWQIPDGDDFGHHDYLPPGTPGQQPDSPTKLANATEFIRRSFLGQSQSWPQ